MSEYPDDGSSGRTYSASEGQRTVKTRGSGHYRWNQAPGSAQDDQGQVQRYQGSKAWWSVGEFLHQGVNVTHHSVGLSLANTDQDSWDLSDSLADLYQAVTQQQQQGQVSRVKGHSRGGSGGPGGGDKVDGDRGVDMRRWLEQDTSHGFIRVYVSEEEVSSRLFPCTLFTSAQKICLQLAIPANSLHVQMNGDIIRRMDPVDCPLAIQNEYLAGLGYSDIKYIQEEGLNYDLAHLIRFYAGKPLSESTYARNQLQTFAYVRKGKLLHQWVRRLCEISGTRLLIYRDKGAQPTVILQLARGAVEEVQVKGQPLVLKVTSTYQDEKSIYISFTSPEDYNKWLRKIRKATVKLPSKADLSNCHLEFLPEAVFMNIELQILILRHNALRERPLDEDLYTIGWLDDFPRFVFLKSLNLADNQLGSFPVSLCGVHSLLELNLASNKLEDIPPQISELVNLQVLHLHNNLLNSLPEEIAQMKNLTVIVLAFNRFASIPSVLLPAQTAAYKLDSIIMAGNEVTRLPADQLIHMAHIKKVDLRLNRLQLLPTETAKFRSLEHVTHLDIRENQIVDLDIRAIRCLEYLNCESNNIKSLQVNGGSLKNLYASHNCLKVVSIHPKPEWLFLLDVSHNQLTELPPWLPDCFFLVHLDVSHNQLTTLPDRLFTDAKKLKILKANHNKIQSLPDKIRTDTLEELHLQSNQIRHLSVELFIKAHRLRYLNMTRNKLCDLPAPNMNDSYNKLQELYLSFNHLNSQCLQKICCFPRLRVLHLAKNKLSVIEEFDIEKLEQLTELNVSSNNLSYLPAVLGRHPKLQVLRANCNLLQELPNFKNSSGLKVLEVSSNQLVNVNMSNLMASQMSLLDISANPNIQVQSRDGDLNKNSKKKLCMVDMRGQNLSLEDVRSQSDSSQLQLWQTGLSQTSGIRNKLSVTAINKPYFTDKGDALFAIFDGGRNEAVASTLSHFLPDVLREERARNQSPHQYMKYTFLSAHRNLKTQGQKLGASGAVVHLHKDEKGQHFLSVGNVGDVQVVLCRHKSVMLLTRSFLVSEDVEEKKRVVQSGGIITEDGRVAGVTTNTRLLGSSYLYPNIVPDPHVTSTALTPEDSCIIMANHGLWQYVSYEEAVAEIMDIPDPVVSAKRLQDLAQGYGSKENISVLVVRLMLTLEERVRIKNIMSTQRSTQKELMKVLRPLENLLELKEGVPNVRELSGVVIQKSGHARKHRMGHKHLTETQSVRSHLSGDTQEDDEDFASTNRYREHEDSRAAEASQAHKKLRKEMSDGNFAQGPENHLYRKKTYPIPNVQGTRLRHNFPDREKNRGDDSSISETILNKDMDQDTGGFSGSKHVDQSRHRQTHKDSIQINQLVVEDDADLIITTKDTEDEIILRRSPYYESSTEAPDFIDYRHSPNSPNSRISPGADFNISPSESVSSIDLRVQEEAEEIYKLRYASHELNRKLLQANALQSELSESSQLNQNELYIRPLTPDSIVSQEEFVKPPVNFSNIDRDALIFHQMQMARAQTQAKSSSSVYSIQSAPMPPIAKSPLPKGYSSSHSIEVLVNLNDASLPNDVNGSLKSGHLVSGSRFGGSSFGGGSRISSSCVANVDSDSERQFFVPRGYQTTVMADVHSSPDREQRLWNYSGEASYETDRVNDDSDNETLVGDAADLANPKDVDVVIPSLNRQRSSHKTNPSTTSLNEVSKRTTQEGNAGDSDSDDSLGDVSLEDGYSAVQFNWINRQTSLSLLNVLESESEEHPDLYAYGAFSRSNESDAIQKSASKSSENNLVIKPRNARFSNDYETIDVRGDQKSQIDEFKDDINPYEEVQYPEEETLKPDHRVVTREEDIDAFYAKVNKIKLKNNNEKSDTTENVNRYSDKLNLSDNSQSGFQNQSLKGNLRHRRSGIVLTANQEEREDNFTFNFNRDILPLPSPSAQSPSLNVSPSDYATVQRKTASKSQQSHSDHTAVLGKSPQNDSGSQSSPTTSSPHLNHHSQHPPGVKCNNSTSDINSPLSPHRSIISVPRSSHSSLSSSYHPSSSNRNLVSLSSPHSHSTNPPLPPKMPYPTTLHSSPNSSQAKPQLPPKPRTFQKAEHTSQHITDYHQDLQHTRFEQSKSSFSPASSVRLTTSNFQGSNQLDSNSQNHYLGPNQPTLTVFPSSSEKLASQKSVLITYL